ncbi:hypothetical protein [Kineosporia sp. NBRC 101731]|uniref:hypothetical protein n=1 Tax=Kineosporia sp. NBRC 101731 TaxID=3032199 RepID=UPI002555D3A2|nr:hypothetical protein [Kineosporia sp. NBRC 101731]
MAAVHAQEDAVGPPGALHCSMTARMPVVEAERMTVTSMLASCASAPSWVGGYPDRTPAMLEPSSAGSRSGAGVDVASSGRP